MSYPKRVLLLAILFFAAMLQAAPHNGDLFRLKQPDGSQVSVRVWGDEYYRRFESVDGYTLIRDAEGWISYAKLNSDSSDFVSTGELFTGESKVSARSLFSISEPKTRGLTLKREAILNKVQEVKAELGNDQETFSTQSFMRSFSEGPTTYGTLDTVLGLTLLIDFSDEPATISQADLDNFCNQVGFSKFGNAGSVRDYFYDISVFIRKWSR